MALLIVAFIGLLVSHIALIVKMRRLERLVDRIRFVVQP